jgi:hypothetical protein
MAEGGSQRGYKTEKRKIVRREVSSKQQEIQIFSAKNAIKLRRDKNSNKILFSQWISFRFLERSGGEENERETRRKN